MKPALEQYIRCCVVKAQVDLYTRSIGLIFMEKKVLK